MKIHSHIWVSLGVKGPIGNFMFFECFPLVWHLPVTKLLRPLVKHWSSMGLHDVLYVYDGVCALATEAKLIEDGNIVLSNLEHAGFVLNISKATQGASTGRG